MRIDDALNEYYRNRQTKTSEVRRFLQHLGIKPIKATDPRALFQKQLGIFNANGRSDLATSFAELETPEELVNFAHSDPLAAKVILGGDFNRLVNAGEFVTRLTVKPNARILDIGGGLGQLSLWMARLWPSAGITLIDKASLELPIRWAKELALENVEFLNDTFEHAQLEAEAFDLAVLSSVLGAILPERHGEFSREEFLGSDSTAQIVAKVGPIVDKLAWVLKPDGIAFVMDGLNETRILLLAKAFESRGFMLQTRYMEPRTRVGEFVALSFARMIRMAGDGAFSASTFLSMNDKRLDLNDGAAETLRELFATATSLYRRESIHGNVKMRVEILEQRGLILFYESSNAGFRHAVMASAALAPLLLKSLSDDSDE